MRQTISQMLATQRRGTFLIFGPPKTGKTQSLASLFKLQLGGPVWYFDFDGGDSIVPFVREAVKLGAQEGDIIRFSYIPVGGTKQTIHQFSDHTISRDIYHQFIKDFNTLDDLIDVQTGAWKANSQAPAVVVIDSFTSFQDVLLDFVLTQVGHELGAKGTDARSDWGLQMGKIRKTVKALQALPCLSIVLAHEKVEMQTIVVANEKLGVG